MNLIEFEFGISHSLRSIGVALTDLEYSGILVALNELKMRSQSDNVYFWGKICGTKCDYFLAYILNNSLCYPSKHFFWCTNSNFKFTNLPEAPEGRQYQESLFSGIPQTTKASVISDGGSDAESNKSIEQAEEVEELERLSWTVHKIDKNTSVVPTGAYFVNETLKIAKDPKFSGLMLEAALDLKNWNHFRPAESTAKLSALGQPNVEHFNNCYDNLSKDVPYGEK
eukprot:Platyproteum_vivax@DN5376_c0_g1_i2.p1